MSVPHNEAIVRRFFAEVWNRGDLAVVDELLAPGYTDHNAPPGSTAGTDGYKQTVAAFRSAFPDIEYELDQVLSERDVVAIRLTGRGTHLAPLMGVAATGKPVTFKAMTIVRIEGGRIVERWGVSDIPGLMSQLFGGPNEDFAAARRVADGGLPADVQVVRADESRSTTWVLGGHNICKATKEDTGGAFSLFLSTFPPGEGVPDHTHLAEDEAYYILDGTWEMYDRSNGHTVTVGPGDYAFVRRGTLHGFKNVSAVLGRMVLVIAPGGIEGFFEGIGFVMSDVEAPRPPMGGPPDFVRAAHVAERYNVTFEVPSDGRAT